MDNLALLSQAISSLNLKNGLPSWVPDWRRPSTSTAPYLVFYDLFEDNERPRLDVQLLPDGTLNVKAAIIDAVDEVGAVYDHQGCTKASEIPDILNLTINNWLSLVGVPKLTGASFTSQFTRGATSVDIPKMLASDSTSRVFPKSSEVISHQDADHMVPRGPLPPQQSYMAPLYRDVDYGNSNKTRDAPERRAVNDNLMPAQSYSAPLYHDEDYPTANVRARIRVTNAPHSLANRGYDSFSHTYVDLPIRELPRYDYGRSPLASVLAKDFGRSYVTGMPSSAVFWRALCMDVVDCERIGRHRRCTDTDSWRVWEWLDWIFQLSKPTGIPQLHWHLNTHLQGKRMIKTKLDYVGLASGDVKQYDKICLFAGEAYPYVLRPTPDGKKYNLVCPAYIHGVMDGVVPHLQDRHLQFTTISIA